MDAVIHFLDLFGTAVFAVTGALAAGRKRLDIFGVAVLGCVTALGGGTLRDVILGSRPIFWISETRYLQVAAVSAIATFFLARRWKMHETVLMYADALGLAVFTIIGFEKAFHVTHSYSIAIVMGMTTGVMGGLIRDVLSGDVPLILRSEIYASASLCGAAVLALLFYLEISVPAALSGALMTTLAIRVSALHWNLSLPLFRLDEEREDERRNS
jgi:uncharacterized membrane protein YeiH